MALSRDEMAAAGRLRVQELCHLNGWPRPVVYDYLPKGTGGTCGFYNGRGAIYVQPRLCAKPGYGGPAWSWPGYMVDRTPYGVYPHELGHHVDQLLRQPGGGRFCKLVRGITGESPISGYCPNSEEWFAEMFRLFATNPDLLSRVRPHTYRLLTAKFGFKPVETRGWRAVLKGAPARTLEMAARRIKENS